MPRVGSWKGLAMVLALAATAAVGARELSAQETPLEGIAFQSSGIPGPETIYLRGIGTDDAGGLLRLEVWANEVTDLYGLSFALHFPRQLFRFPKARSSVYVEGPFLSEDGAEETVLLVRQVGKDILIGHTRTGEAPGVNGSGLLMTLEFRGLEVAGKRLFRLRRTHAFDSSGAPAEAYTWLPGKAIVTVAE